MRDDNTTGALPAPPVDEPAPAAPYIDKECATCGGRGETAAGATCGPCSTPPAYVTRPV